MTSYGVALEIHHGCTPSSPWSLLPRRMTTTSGATDRSEVRSRRSACAVVYPMTPPFTTSTFVQPCAWSVCSSSAGYEVPKRKSSGASRQIPNVVESPRQRMRSVPGGFGDTTSRPRSPSASIMMPRCRVLVSGNVPVSEDRVALHPWPAGKKMRLAKVIDHAKPTLGEEDGQYRAHRGRGEEPASPPAGHRQAGSCCVMQWSVPSPSTRSTAWMPTTRAVGEELGQRRERRAVVRVVERRHEHGRVADVEVRVARGQARCRRRRAAPASAAARRAARAPSASVACARRSRFSRSGA